MTIHTVKPENSTSFLSKLAMAELIKRAEDYAVDQVFCNLPDLSYEEIIALCRDDEAREKHNEEMYLKGDDDLCLALCEEYEYTRWQDVPGLLEEKKESIINHFSDLTEDN